MSFEIALERIQAVCFAVNCSIRMGRPLRKQRKLCRKSELLYTYSPKTQNYASIKHNRPHTSLLLDFIGLHCIVSNVDCWIFSTVILSVCRINSQDLTVGLLHKLPSGSSSIFSSFPPLDSFKCLNDSWLDRPTSLTVFNEWRTSSHVDACGRLRRQRWSCRWHVVQHWETVRFHSWSPGLGKPYRTISRQRLYLRIIPYFNEDVSVFYDLPTLTTCVTLTL